MDRQTSGQLGEHRDRGGEAVQERLVADRADLAGREEARGGCARERLVDSAGVVVVAAEQPPPAAVAREEQRARPRGPPPRGPPDARGPPPGAGPPRPAPAAPPP